MSNIKKRVPDFPKSQLILGNFFDIGDTFDLVIEQTFFCAIAPKLREAFAIKTHCILKEKGKLVGLLFNVPLHADRPPFGGHLKEYKNYFKPYFEFKTVKSCYNSTKSRQGRELFMQLEKK